MNLRADSASERASRDGAATDLLRSLVAALHDDVTRPAALASAEGEEILLDSDVDGHRYLLLRLPAADGRASLSPREQEIARMVAAGYASKTIASVLNISSWTVGTHLRRIFAKLGVKSRAAMVGRLHEAGLLAAARVPAPAPESLPEAAERAAAMRRRA